MGRHDDGHGAAHEQDHERGREQEHDETEERDDLIGVEEARAPAAGDQDDVAETEIDEERTQGYT